LGVSRWKSKKSGVEQPSPSLSSSLRRGIDFTKQNGTDPEGEIAKFPAACQCCLSAPQLVNPLFGNRRRSAAAGMILDAMKGEPPSSTAADDPGRSPNVFGGQRSLFR
jgi:hypothetical protein